MRPLTDLKRDRSAFGLIGLTRPGHSYRIR
jgi:hypothetical protein